MRKISAFAQCELCCRKHTESSRRKYYGFWEDARPLWNKNMSEWLPLHLPPCNIQSTVKYHLQGTADIPSTAAVDSTLPPAAFLLFPQQVILLLCSVTQTLTDQSPCTLFFTELVLLMEKSPHAISPIPLLIFSVFSRPLPTPCHTFQYYPDLKDSFITTSVFLPDGNFCHLILSLG